MYDSTLEEYDAMIAYVWNEIIGKCWSSDTLKAARRLIDELESERKVTEEGLADG